MKNNCEQSKTNRTTTQQYYASTWPSKPYCPVEVKWNCSVVSNSLQPHGLYSPWISPGENTGVGSLSQSQGIFPIQGSNPGLSQMQADSFPAEPKNTGVGSLSLLQWIFLTQELNWVFCTAGEYLQVVIHEKEDRQSQYYAGVFSKVTSGKWLLHFPKFGKEADFTVVVAWN